MRILFLGNDLNPISIASLEALLTQSDHEIMVGFHQGTGGSLTKTAIREFRMRGAGFVARRGRDLLRAGIRRRVRAMVPLPGCRSIRELLLTHPQAHRFAAASVNAAPALDRIREFDPDLIAVAAFSSILKRQLIRIPELGCINVHPSLLPRYRGPNPFYWVLHNGERETGVSVLYIDEGVDTGDIILQESFEIRPDESERTLRDRSAPICARLLVDAVKLIAAGTAPRSVQREEGASYYSHPPRGKSRL